MNPTAPVADIFRRFTDRSRTAVVKSESFARREGSATVDPRHLLLGVIAAEGTGLEALRGQIDITPLGSLAAVDDEVYAHLAHVPYQTESKKVLEQALLVAISAEHDEIRTEHLLAALLDREDEEVRRMLTAHRVDADALRRALPAPDPNARAAARAELAEKVPLREVPIPKE